MEKASVSNGKILTLKTLGVLGYLALTVQMLWLVVAYLPDIMASDAGRSILLPEPLSQHITTTPPPQLEIPSSVAIVIAIITVIGIVGITLFSLYRLPSTIGKAASKTVHKTSDLLLPTLTHHKKIPKKRLFVLNRRIELILKLSVSLLLTLPLLLMPVTQLYLSSLAILYIGLFLLTVTTAWFLIQFALAIIWKIDHKLYW